MVPIKPQRTNQIIASDFAGPLNVTARGNKYIQVITDLYGKYLVLVAHPDKETRSAVKGLIENCERAVYLESQKLVSQTGDESTSPNYGTCFVRYLT